jgi:methionyl-tRNA synthetase
MKYLCYTCSTVVEEKPCPVCGEVYLENMCELDNIKCHHDVIQGIAYCKKCGKPVCPICNAHSVVQISRVTGYYQDVSGWNEAKKQELKDRVRYSI